MHGKIQQVWTCHVHIIINRLNTNFNPLYTFSWVAPARQKKHSVNNQFTDASINGRLYLEKRCCSAYNSSISTSVYCPGTCTAKMSCRLQTSATLLHQTWTVRAPPTIIQTNLSSVSGTLRVKAFLASPTQHGTK